MTRATTDTRPADRVLAVGIYLADRSNTALQVAGELRSATRWQVDQRWVGIGSSPAAPALAEVTVARLDAVSPKFTLLNRLLGAEPLDQYAFVIICDDDVLLPAGFVDRYLSFVAACDFALAQPARTHDSYIDHPFVEQLDGIDARWTSFVEIGPVISIRRDAMPLLVPFDQSSPMGWGYDLVWPVQLSEAGLRLGIVDATPVAHNVRMPVTEYSHALADGQMHQYLRQQPHLSHHEAFVIHESYA